MTHMPALFLFDTDGPHTRFSAAGNDSLTTRYGDRRLKSASSFPATGANRLQTPLTATPRCNFRLGAQTSRFHPRCSEIGFFSRWERSFLSGKISAWVVGAHHLRPLAQGR